MPFVTSRRAAGEPSASARLAHVAGGRRPAGGRVGQDHRRCVHGQERGERSARVTDDDCNNDKRT
eukprot:scaffold28_cov515-Prasinococcus_capsulatus_cf.AAC.11